ncbi:DUF3267 domain-containing protein [Salipaludibacillus daqingensis]|uniref:DUF3267 domain-containing protein n=1 Tax=Salipaludibacillus daqingensis TaxID=3041001 RepID=UPI002476CDCA|nr:DUF3267 domain-containing protein [Salipaludibacillus daqingensis]
MKIVSRIPDWNEQKHTDLLNNDWKPLKEPESLFIAICLSLPLMVINVFLAIGLMMTYTSLTLVELGVNANGVVFSIHFGLIIGLILFIIIHEFIHLVFIPNFSKSSSTLIGLTLFGGFVYTEELIGKTKFLIISLAPFIILSIVLPFILHIFGLLTTFMKVLILVNAAASSVDVLNVFLIKQVPTNAVLTSNGNKTYWKKVA